MTITVSVVGFKEVCFSYTGNLKFFFLTEIE